MDPMDLRQAFDANLRRLRHAKGISQEDLAYEAGINRSYMSKLEKGASYPGLGIITKLATVPEVEPAELLGRTRKARGSRMRPNTLKPAWLPRCS
jgi:transcriptional regulator with XRE-family HTH domain